MVKFFSGVLLVSMMGLAESASFMNVPGYIGPPDAQRAVTNRALTMVSSLAVTPGGRMWATWYAGVTPGEDQNNYVVLATSEDNGQSWIEVLAVDPDWTEPVRAFDPEIWMAPDGNLYLFWAQAVGHDGAVAGVWSLKITNSEEPEPQFDRPERWTDGVMMCKPIILSTGEWVLPASTWRTTDNSARMVVSSDQGKSWTVRGGCNVPEEARNFDEHMIVERQNGSLWMLARTKYGIGESVSTDRGKTWPELNPSAIPHPGARFFITRLSSGNLLLVKHGPMNERTGRSHLMAFISTDDGKTWGGGLLLDERKGISYPDGQQADDGTIYITYDYSRTGAREILFAAFREKDAAAGEAVSGAVRLRQLISKGSGGQKRKPKPEEQPRGNADGAVFQKNPAGAFVPDRYDVAPFSIGQTLFTDRGYKVAEVPPLLEDTTFLRVPIEGEKQLVCSQPGMLYFLTPQPERNRDSQSKQLEAQGFKKVALPEIRLFNPGHAGNWCTLYQKNVAVGEIVTVGKWAVPIFFNNP
jgi:predicted neuraminidase